MTEMTDAQYVYEGASKCPHCKSKKIENCETPEYSCGSIFQPVECYDCGKIWDEEYKLIGWLPEGDRAT